jgi:UDP-N-acetylmuramate dehydrogenase
MIIHKDVPLKGILYYKIGGTSPLVLEAKSHQDIIDAFTYIRDNSIDKFLVVGLGANLVMPDTKFDGAIIWINKSTMPYIKLLPDGLVEAYAGQTLDDLIQFSFQNSLIGLEALGGLPSTIGGAIRGNAGAFGVEMKDVVAKVEVLDTTTGEIKMFDNKDSEFSYRNSFFKQHHNLIILRGFFTLKKATDEEIEKAKSIYRVNILYREKNHPIEYPSCGSVFKNIKGEENVAKILAVWPDIEDTVLTKWHGKVSMGYIIKRLGFQGIRVGGAKITNKHANYISNVDGATYHDVVSIINQIREKFNETFGFYPDLEAEIVT